MADDDDHRSVASSAVSSRVSGLSETATRVERLEIKLENERTWDEANELSWSCGEGPCVERARQPPLIA